MKKILSVVTAGLLFSASFAQSPNDFVSADVSRFWEAYDKITATKDSALQYKYINELYISKATPGLAAIMDARRYNAASYVNAINQYPLFWKSIRKNIATIPTVSKQMYEGVVKFKQLYPDMRPAKIYFTIGAFRTNGTTVDGQILIGSELAMADSTTVSSEFAQNFSHLRGFFAGNPLENIVFLNVHEYVHTQQLDHDYNLLYRCLYEGIAEFTAAKVMGEAGVAPAITYGKTHEKAVKEKFVKVLYSPHAIGDWLYNNTNNIFNMRDLGYYVGYAIAEKYYNKSADKKLALKQMIQLDYADESAVANYVDKSGYFDKPLSQLREAYEKDRPEVTGISPFNTGDKQVDPSITRFTINFSQPMDTRFRNFELGPAGESRLLRITNFVGFSEDRKSATFEMMLKPGEQYEIEVGAGFRTEEGSPLKPYLIEFTTMKK